MNETLDQIRSEIIQLGHRIEANDGRLSADSSADLDHAHEQLDWWLGQYVEKSATASKAWAYRHMPDEPANVRVVANKLHIDPEMIRLAAVDVLRYSYDELVTSVDRVIGTGRKLPRQARLIMIYEAPAEFTTEQLQQIDGGR